MLVYEVDVVAAAAAAPVVVVMAADSVDSTMGRCRFLSEVTWSMARTNICRR